MRLCFEFALLCSALVAIAQAQDSSPLDAFPDCAVDCILDGFVQGYCLPTDQDCICSDPSFQGNVTSCVKLSCAVPDALLTRNASLANCGSPIRDRSSDIYYITIPLASLSVTFVLLRFASIIYAKIGVALDDWLMLATICVAVPSCSTNIFGLAGNGYGKDIWTLPGHKINRSLFYFYQTAWMYFLSTTLVKMSIVAFYLRIFPQTSTKRLLWGTFAFLALWGALFLGLILLQCQPVSYFWDRWDGAHEGKCINGNAIGWAHASTNIALELWIMGIPLNNLRKLQLRWRRKIGIAFMFSLGIFVTVMSCFRLRSLVKLARTENKTWEYTPVIIWSTIELCVSIICGCLPAARLLIVRLFPRLRGSTQDSSNQSYPFKPRTRSSGFRNRSPHGNSIHITAVETRLSTDQSSGQGIKFQKTYDVRHMDTDETSLVPMHHMGVPEGNRVHP